MSETLLFHRSDFGQSVEPKGYPAKVAKKYFNYYESMEYFIYSRIAPTKSQYKLLRGIHRSNKTEKQIVGYYKVSKHRKGPSFNFVELKHHDDKTKSN